MDGMANNPETSGLPIILLLAKVNVQTDIDYGIPCLVLESEHSGQRQ